MDNLEVTQRRQIVSVHLTDFQFRLYILDLIGLDNPEHYRVECLVF